MVEITMHTVFVAFNSTSSPAHLMHRGNACRDPTNYRYQDTLGGYTSIVHHFTELLITGPHPGWTCTTDNNTSGCSQFEHVANF